MTSALYAINLMEKEAATHVNEQVDVIMVENPIKADKNEDISAKPLTEAAKRALKEAAERKALAEKAKTVQQSEIDGRGGLDPVRFGDWEKKGIAVDF